MKRYKQKFEEKTLKEFYSDDFEALRQELKNANKIISVGIFSNSNICVFEGKLLGDFRNANYIKVFSKNYECTIWKHQFIKWEFQHQMDTYFITTHFGRINIGI